jgi:DNA-binding HxlR family transcriptional regulator
MFVAPCGGRFWCGTRGLVVCDRWTLLILRELMLGTRRFDELQAQTGMSSHLLSVRLKRLEKDGILERRCTANALPDTRQEAKNWTLSCCSSDPGA